MSSWTGDGPAAGRRGAPPPPYSHTSRSGRGVGGEGRDAPDLLALTYSRNRASAPELVAAAQAAGLEITDITTEEPKLEQVFLSLTQSVKAD